MKHYRLFAAVVLASASLTLVAGCSVARNQETAGEYVDGSVVTTRVKARLADDPYTSAASINVKTIRGSEVQLSGYAKSEQEKLRAGEIARTTPGVTSVSNDLIVK